MGKRKIALICTVLVGGAAVMLLWREIQAFQVGKVEPGMAGITLPEVLNVRITSPMLAENNPGLSAALLAHLARVCRELPRKEQVNGCLAIVAPNPEPREPGESASATQNAQSSQLPEELRKFAPINAFIRQWPLGLPANTPVQVISLTTEIQGWTARRVENTPIFWLQPQERLRSVCGFLPRPQRLNPLDAVPFLSRVGQIVEPSQGTLEPVQLPGLGPADVGRIYVLFSTGDIVIWSRRSHRDDSDDAAVQSELKRWKTLDSRPCFAQASYYAPPFSAAFRNSSPYLDRAGLGFNVTITGPPQDHSGITVIPGMDITFQPESLAGPMGRFASLVTVDTEAPSWNDIGAALLKGAKTKVAKNDKRDLADRVQKCVYGLAPSSSNDSRFLQCPEQLAAAGERIVAMHLGEKKWLVAALGPEAAPGWPIWTGPFLAVGVLGGIVWLALRTRRTEQGSIALVAAFDRLNVPIIVTDPNSDTIRGGNAAALEHGFVPQKKFLDVVEEIARPQYQTNQPVGAKRRGYGTRIKDLSQAGSLDAIVRSADIRANVDHLEALPGDRLALVLPLQPDDDLYWIQADLRQQFAELLDHGIVALINGLDLLIASNPALAQDLFRLLTRNQKFVLALFSSPDQMYAVSDGNDGIVLREGLHSTLSVLRRVFFAAGAELGLREMLGLEGGTLDGLSQAPPEVFREEIQWPEAVALRVRLPGAVGFFVTEALRNAVRHGKARSVPRLEVKREGLRMTFTVINAVRDSSFHEVRRKQGGLRLMKMAASVLGWDFEAGQDAEDETQFVCSWTVKIVEATPA
ncbi:MAG TPA: hypothetical protein VKZ53_28730 [Candidatus Angelobacter sp.]|nr:hypothetical protein [Candidatus Angelobacter sp.]